MTIRFLGKTRGPNDGTRTLEESTLAPELVVALKDWKAGTDHAPLLIGGLALSYHVKPRFTQDIDLLFLNPSEVPSDVPGFKKIREHAFEHLKTGVEVKVLDPAFINVPALVVRTCYERSTQDRLGFKIPDRESLIVLKLHRYSLQDRADIKALHEDVPQINLKDWHIESPDVVKNYTKTITEDLN